MKNIYRKLAFSFLMFGAFSASLMAQPLPPTSPSGHPIPLGGISIFALIIAGVYTVVRKDKKK